MAAAENVERVKGIYEAVRRADVGALEAVASPELVLRAGGDAPLPIHGEFRGRDGLARYVAAIAAEVELARVAPFTFVAQGDRVAVEGATHGTARRSGQPLAVDWATSFTFGGDGRVRSVVQHTDTAAMVAAFEGRARGSLGIAPAPRVETGPANPACAAVYHALLAAVMRGDPPAAAPYFTEDAVLRAGGAIDFPAAGRFDGPAGAVRYFAQLGEAIEITRFDVRDTLASGDHLVVEGSDAAVIRRNGRRFEHDWLMVLVLRDGKVARYAHYYDTDTLERAYRAPWAADVGAAP